MLEQTYPDAGRATIGNWTGQLWRLLREMAVGDLVVLPLKSRAEIAIGQIAGEYRFRADAPLGFGHVRAVTWLRTDVSRAAVRQDLLDSMGSLLTVCRLERFEAAERIDSLARSGIDPGPSGGGTDELGSIRALAERAAASTPDGPLRLTIRELLSCWDAVRRTPNNVAQIEADLVDLGLTTRPPFTEGWIDNVIEVLAVGEEPAEEAAATTDHNQQADGASDFPPITLRIDVLRSANVGVTAVHPDDGMRTALTKLIANNYSQLAVLDENGVLLGAIGWESIGKAQVAGPATTVRSATVAARPVDHNEDLLSQIEEIYRSGFVFVRGADMAIVGIVTAADLTERFGELVRPLVLIEEAERRLRRRVDEVFTSDEIWALTNKRAKSAATMTVGSYTHVLKSPENWNRMCWALEHQLFLDHLEEVRKIRNEFMHFSPDQLNGTQILWLEGFIRLLRAVDPRA